jgi:hypothetical protein
MSVEWIKYKNKKILVTTYKGLNPEQMIDEINKQADIIRQTEGKVLLLDDFTGSYVNDEFMDAVKKLGKSLGPKTEKSAVLGVTGIKKILLKAYNVFIKDPVVPFETKEEALEFLVGE